MPDADPHEATQTESSVERTQVRATPPPVGQDSLGEATHIPEGSSFDGLGTVQVEATQLVVRPPSLPGDPKGVPFGRYELLSELGRGGMGIVFKAWDTQLRRIVALKKILSAGHESRLQLDRFTREAQLAAKLRHPHIVGVLDVGAVGGQHYFTSDFIDGPSLFQAMKTQVPLRQRVSWVKAIAEALHYAHGHGIVHRDVKPENILLDAGGNPFVTDFGLAKEVDLGSSPGPAITNSGALLGTPAYMSPEQAGGRLAEVGPASDQYSLGVVLYHLLAGKLPFDETGLHEFLSAVIEKDPVAPSRVNPAVHRDIEAICLKAMEKDHARRYPDVAAMAADLGRYLDGEPIQARPVSWMGRVWRKAKRNRTVAMLGVGLATAMVGVLLMAFFYGVLPSLQASAERRAAEEARANRRRDAGTLLSLARGALARGEHASARASATKLLGDFAERFEHGEDIPIGEAHAVLGEVARGEGQARVALIEFYRAFEASVGRTGEATSLVAVGRQLAEMHEYAQASRMFERALAAGAAPREAFLARLGLARATLVEARFEEARRAFMELHDAAEASRAELEEIAATVRFLDAISGSTRIRIRGMDPADGAAFVDLEDDHVIEVLQVTRDHKGVAVWRIDGGEGKEIGRAQVLSSEPFALAIVDAHDLDGDGVKEIVVGGGRGDAKAGVVAVLGFVEGKLELLARAPLAGSIHGVPFAVADLEGDGLRELIVGTAVYERSMRIYRFDRKRRALDQVALIPLGGDATVMAVQDANGNGRPEVWAFVGAWTTYGLLVFEADPEKKALALLAQVPLSEQYHMRRTTLPGGGFLVGTGWSEMALNAFQAAVGAKQLGERYRKPGVYELRWGPQGGVDVATVWTRSDSEDWRGSGLATPILAKGATYAWASAPLDAPEPGCRRSPPIRIFERGGDTWQPLAWVSPPPSMMYPSIHDFDGDGDTELYFLLPDEEGVLVRVYGMGRPEIICRELPGMEGSAGEARRPRRTVPPALAAGRETERVGLYDEALTDYRRVLESPSTEDDLEEAGLGVVRCGVAQETYEETSREVSELMKRHPMMGPAFGRALLDALEEAGEWDLAVAAAEELGRSPVLSTTEADEVRARADRLRALASPGVVFDAERDLAVCDLLATTPLAMRIEVGGKIVFHGCSQGLREVFVPLAYDCTNYRIEATIGVRRHEWANDVEIGLVAGDPAAVFVGTPWSLVGMDLPRAPVKHVLWMGADGETAHPNRFWDLKCDMGLGPTTSRVRSGVEVPLDSTEFRMEFAPHQRRLRFGSACIEDAAMTDTRVLLAIGASGRVGTGEFASEVWIEGLKLKVGGRGTKLATYNGRRAIDTLLLANGRWIQGRVEEARQFYDLAVQLGDEEAARETELGKRGLPSRLDAPAARHEKHVATDARFWRGLLRAETKGTAAATEDLAAAASRDRARFEELIGTSVHALKGRTALVAAIRGFLMKGRTPPPPAAELGAAIHQRWGIRAAEALLEGSGVRPLQRPVVAQVESVPGKQPALRAGDMLLTIDGSPLSDVVSFQRLLGEARGRGAEKVTLRILREGKPLEVELGLTDARVNLQQGLLFEPEPK